MCGISGIISKKALTRIDIESVARMNQAVSHRGPDGVGFFEAQNIALAMRRLSIIDIQGGHQPLYNEDRTIVLISNGEIYNFLELKANLEKRGHHFATHSDCEAILHLYEEEGADCVHSLRGMFAFALWDACERRMLLVRDRMGEKPLYLWQDGGRLVFCSELRALLVSGFVQGRLDPVSLHQYLHFNYVPEPRTILKDIRKLDAGCLLTVDVDSWSIKESRYWDLTRCPEIYDDIIPCIQSALEDVGKLVIRSDVPVGVALSGGMDSSLIASLAQHHYPGRITAFTVGYEGTPACDERADASRLAGHLGLPFHEVLVQLEDVSAKFPEIVQAADDPIADISAFGYWSVARKAREAGVPVLLFGQGGDELFWGYPEVRQAVRQTTRKLGLRRGELWRILQYLTLSRPNGIEPWRIRLWLKNGCGLNAGWSDLLRDMKTPGMQAIMDDLLADYREADLLAMTLYTPAWRCKIGPGRPSDLFMLTGDVSPEIEIMSLICRTYLRENGLAQTDRLAMASSIESRAPLVDYRLVEIVTGLRKAHSDFRAPPKQWLRQAASKYLPEWVLDRRKRGFEPPVWQWYRILFSTYGSWLIDGWLVREGVLESAAAAQMAEGRIPPGGNMPLCFKLLVLESWCRSNLGGGRL